MFLSTMERITGKLSTIDLQSDWLSNHTLSAISVQWVYVVY